MSLFVENVPRNPVYSRHRYNHFFNLVVVPGFSCMSDMSSPFLTSRRLRVMPSGVGQTTICQINLFAAYNMPVTIEGSWKTVSKYEVSRVRSRVLQ